MRTTRGASDQDFLQLELVPVWIMSVQLRRVSETVRAKVGYVQEYLLASVYAAFTRLAGLPDGPSRAVEDLRALDRIDPALQRWRSASVRLRPARIAPVSRGASCTRR